MVVFALGTATRGPRVDPGIDPLWALSGASAGSSPLPVLSLLDGYFVGAGASFGVIAFASGPSAAEGLAVTMLALLVLLLIAIISGCWKRWARAPAVPRRAVSPGGAGRDAAGAPARLAPTCAWRSPACSLCCAR